MKIGEFFITLGVDAQTVKVKDFVKAISDMPLAVAAGIAALAGIEYELTKLAAEAINTAVGFQMFEAQTGLSAQALQRWQIVAQQANVSADSVSSSVQGLQRQMAEIRLGRGNFAPFQLFHINPNDDPFTVLQQLRGRMNMFDRGTTVNLLSQMGISPDMIQLLTLSEKKFTEFSRTVSGMSKHDEEALLKAKLTMTQFAITARELGFTVIAHLAGGFQMLLDTLGQFQGILPAIGIALLALGAYFFPVTAAIAAFVLILEDVAVYFRGGKSLTGDFVEGLKMMFTHPIEYATQFLNLLNQITAKLTGADLKKGMASFFDLPTDVMEGLTGGDWEGLRADLFGARQMQPAAAGGASIQQTNHITITGVDKPHETGRAVKEELGRQFSAAAAMTDNSGT